MSLGGSRGSDPSYSAFLLLPSEIRSLIFYYLLPDKDDICRAPGFKESHNDDLEWHDEMFSSRQDGERCHPVILAVNRQINVEASRSMY